MLLEFDPNAQLELEEATSYYDSINRKLGNTFVDAVERTLNRIVQFPEAWTPMIESTRRCHIDGFPYFLGFRILRSLGFAMFKMLFFVSH